MDILPKKLMILNSNLEPEGQPVFFERVDPRSEEARRFKESDWDRIIVQHLPVLSAALRGAEMIQEDSTLRFLGSQIDQVDVLLAEVGGEDDFTGSDTDPNGWGDFRRLVLVEDKLLRNPEQKRTVLAQILDYAQKAEENWSAETLGESLKGMDGWLTRNAVDIDDTLSSGDFLLVIASDQISSGLQKLANRFAARDNPLNLSELCLVSMPLFSYGETRILIPHIVDAVERNTRDMTIQVRVTNEQGDALPAQVSLLKKKKDPRLSLPRRDEVAQFLAGLRDHLDGEILSSDLQLEVTAKPRKSLSYHAQLKELGAVSFKVHFGGYTRAQWSPILVGFILEAKDRDNRDHWKQLLSSLVSNNQLPETTKVELAGQVTTSALVKFPWTQPKNLTDELSAEIATNLSQFFSAIEPHIIKAIGTTTVSSAD